MITAADVERAAATLSEAGPLEPLRGVRRAMASRMAHAHAEVVPATVIDDADVERLARQATSRCGWSARSSPAARLEPALNAWYDSQSQGRRLHRKIDLGIAVDTDGRPVRAGAARRRQPRRGRSAPRPRAHEGRHPGAHHPARGAARRHASRCPTSARSPAATPRPVVVPPQVAILSTGRAIGRGRWRVDGELAVRRVMPLSLTFDHRVVTGGEAARFLAAVIADLELAE